MRKEVSIGVFAVITIAAAIWGYKYLSGTNILKNSKSYTTSFTNVDGLESSDPVLFRGLNVGTVTKISPNKDFSSLVVTLMIENEDFEVPANVTAELVGQIMGSRSIRLTCNPCSTELLPNKSEIPGNALGLIGSLVDKEELSDYISVLEEGMGGIVDSLSSGFTNDSSEIAGAIKDLRQTATYLKSSTFYLNKVLRASSGNIEQTMSNLASITGNLATNNVQISDLLQNFSAFSAKLNSSGMDSSIVATKALLENTNQAVLQLNSVLAALNKTGTQLQDKGNTAGALLNDRELYDKLNKTLREFELLAEDLRLHPKRYFRVLSKKEIPYQAPKEEEKQQPSRSEEDTSVSKN